MRYWKNAIVLAVAALSVLLAGYAVSSYLADRSADAEPTKVMLRKRIADVASPITGVELLASGALLESSAV